MIVGEFITIVLTSASISASLAWLTKLLLKHSLDRQLQLELEKARSAFTEHAAQLKSALEQAAKLQADLTQKRLGAYPSLIELAHRLRNMARNICSGSTTLDAGVAKAFAAKLLELEESLFRNTFYLEADEAMALVHRFKGCVSTFNIVLGDIVYLMEAGDRGGASEKLTEASKIFDGMDKLHTQLNRRIVKLISVPPPMKIRMPTVNER